jgi:hypothetical protein
MDISDVPTFQLSERSRYTQPESSRRKHHGPTPTTDRSLNQARTDFVTATTAVVEVAISAEVRSVSFILPEPGSIALFGSGLVGLYAMLRHRRVAKL